MSKRAVTTVKRCANRLLHAASNFPVVYPLCKRIVDLHNNENNGDPAINGELCFLRERLLGASVAFDIGANVGDWTALALETNSGLRIHCFEPCRKTFLALSAREFPGGVVRNQFALGDEPGTAVLHVTGEVEQGGGGCNSLHFRKDLVNSGYRTETVRVETFDLYCKEAGIGVVDLVKIDTEGNELRVLMGMREALREGRVGAVQFEYGGTYVDARIWLRDIWEFVEGLGSGYRIYKLYPDGPRRISEYKSALENFQYANYALLREI